MGSFGGSPNWVDFVLLIFIFSFQVEGFKKGFLILAVELSGFLLSIWGAFQFYGPVSQLLVKYFELPHGFSNAIAFLAIGTFVESFYSLIILNLIFARFNLPIITSAVNRILGMFLGIVKGALFVAFFLTFTISLPVPSSLRKDLFNSKIGGPLLYLTSGFSQTLGKAFGGAVSDTLTFFTVEPQTTETVNLNFKTADVTVSETDEQAMYELVNKERVKMGLKALVFDEKLRDVAREHARDMFLRGYFSHVDPDGKSPADRVKEAGIAYFVVGENLALAPSVELAHNGLMNSPKHRDNILSSEYGKIGVGVMDGGIFGKMFTQNFTD